MLQKQNKPKIKISQKTKWLKIKIIQKSSKIQNHPKVKIFPKSKTLNSFKREISPKIKIFQKSKCSKSLLKSKVKIIQKNIIIKIKIILKSKCSKNLNYPKNIARFRNYPEGLVCSLWQHMGPSQLKAKIKTKKKKEEELRFDLSDDTYKHLLQTIKKVSINLAF